MAQHCWLLLHNPQEGLLVPVAAHVSFVAVGALSGVSLLMQSGGAWKQRWLVVVVVEPPRSVVWRRMLPGETASANALQR